MRQWASCSHCCLKLRGQQRRHLRIVSRHAGPEVPHPHDPWRPTHTGGVLVYGTLGGSTLAACLLLACSQPETTTSNTYEGRHPHRSDYPGTAYLLGTWRLHMQTSTSSLHLTQSFASRTYPFRKTNRQHEHVHHDTCWLAAADITEHVACCATGCTGVGRGALGCLNVLPASGPTQCTLVDALAAKYSAE